MVQVIANVGKLHKAHANPITHGKNVKGTGDKREHRRRADPAQVVHAVEAKRRAPPSCEAAREPAIPARCKDVRAAGQPGTRACAYSMSRK